MLKVFPVSQIKSRFFLCLSPARSAAKTNWRCDECNKYDRWDICRCWPHTTRQSPGSRCCSDLQPPSHFVISSSHTNRRWALLSLHGPPQLIPSLRETGLISPLTELHVQHDYARIVSAPIKPAMILQIIKSSVMADSYWSNFCREERTGLRALLMCLLIKMANWSEGCVFSGNEHINQARCFVK